MSSSTLCCTVFLSNVFAPHRLLSIAVPLESCIWACGFHRHTCERITQKPAVAGSQTSVFRFIAYIDHSAVNTSQKNLKQKFKLLQVNKLLGVGRYMSNWKITACPCRSCPGMLRLCTFPPSPLPVSDSSFIASLTLSPFCLLHTPSSIPCAPFPFRFSNPPSCTVKNSPRIYSIPLYYSVTNNGKAPH